MSVRTAHGASIRILSARRATRRERQDYEEEAVNALDLVACGFQHVVPAATERPRYAPGDLLKRHRYGSVYPLHSNRYLEQRTRRRIEVMWRLQKLRRQSHSDSVGLPRLHALVPAAGSVLDTAKEAAPKERLTFRFDTVELGRHIPYEALSACNTWAIKQVCTRS